ncbi:hypothetical protein Q428_13950 [Fervidicella metallireducens AeB]|uniref:Radical SAM core domain-containing protein n=1 Tax=Fervidicella metallireducens AeB TaxID=1403537 RepID=A0A017RS78_9CLOT|nr:radical SAM protein [Fervidicella metallireducens]EYE87324.1 hypothetical protein Q428_13950 [Fervidicella metallireducens AeB]
MENKVCTHNSILKGPYQLTVDITNRCNLRCLHCYNFSGENNICTEGEMTDSELVALVKDIASIKPLNVCFCGGEPLLRKDILLKCIKILNDEGIQVSFVTNGLLLTPEVSKQLKEAGLSRAQISIDGIGKSHDRLRRHEGAFEKAAEALQNLKDVKIETGVAFTPTSWNTEEFDQIVDFCIELSVREIRVQATMPIGRGEENDREILPNSLQYRRMIKSFNRRKRESLYRGRGIRFEWGDPVDHFIRFSEYNKECCPFVSIKADGGIAPSIYLPIVVGNVKKHSLIEYWKNGLGAVWKLDIIQKVSRKIKSVREINMDYIGMPKTFKDSDIELDIIENKNLKYIDVR